MKTTPQFVTLMGFPLILRMKIMLKNYKSDINSKPFSHKNWKVLADLMLQSSLFCLGAAALLSESLLWLLCILN